MNRRHFISALLATPVAGWLVGKVAERRGLRVKYTAGKQWHLRNQADWDAMLAAGGPHKDETVVMHNGCSIRVASPFSCGTITRPL